MITFLTHNKWITQIIIAILLLVTTIFGVDNFTFFDFDINLKITHIILFASISILLIAQNIFIETTEIIAKNNSIYFIVFLVALLFSMQFISSGPSEFLTSSFLIYFMYVFSKINLEKHHHRKLFYFALLLGGICVYQYVYSIYFLVFLLVLYLETKYSIKTYVVLFSGFILGLITTVNIFFLLDKKIEVFYLTSKSYPLVQKTIYSLNINYLMAVVVLFFSLFVLGGFTLLKTQKKRAGITKRANTLMFIFFIASLAACFLSISAFFIFLCIGFSYVTTTYFIESKQTILKELLFWMYLFAGIIVIVL